jgi:Predicted transcription regulator containing HTH domain
MSGTASIERKAITRLIRNKSEFNQIRAEWMTLMDAPKGSAERDRFELLTILIGAYESEREPEPDLPSPQAAVRFMVEQKGLSQGELAELLGGRSRLSEFMTGGHELSKTQIKTLRDELGIPADLLIG